MVRDCLELKKKSKLGQAWVYYFSRNKAKKDPSVIACMLSTSKNEVYVLFYFGSTHTFVSSKFAKLLGKSPTILDKVLNVSTPAGSVMWL